MTAFAFHLRTNLARWGVIPLTALCIAVTFARSRYWIGIWPEAGAAAQVSAVFVGIFGAGFAAWMAATIDVRGLREQTAAASVPAWAIDGLRLGATLTWVLVPYLAVSATCAVATAATVHGSGVGEFVNYVVLGLISVVFGTTFGWFVGRLLTPRLATIVAALGWFIAASILGAYGSASEVSGPPWYEMNSGVLMIRLAAVLLLVAVMTLIPARDGSFVRRVGLAVTVFGLVVATHVATDARSYREPVANPLCVSGRIEYCLWPEDAKYASLIKEVDSRIGELPVELPLPDRMVEYALSGSFVIRDDIIIQLPGDFDPEFDISEGNRWALAHAVSTAIVDTVFIACLPQELSDPDLRREQLRAWLEWRLVGGGEPDYRTDAPDDLQNAWTLGRKVAASASPEEQATWVQRMIRETNDQYCRTA